MIEVVVAIDSALLQHRFELFLGSGASIVRKFMFFSRQMGLVLEKLK